MRQSWNRENIYAVNYSSEEGPCQYKRDYRLFPYRLAHLSALNCARCDIYMYIHVDVCIKKERKSERSLLVCSCTYKLNLNCFTTIVCTDLFDNSLYRGQRRRLFAFLFWSSYFLQSFYIHFYFVRWKTKIILYIVY